MNHEVPISDFTKMNGILAFEVLKGRSSFNIEGWWHLKYHGDGVGGSLFHHKFVDKAGMEIYLSNKKYQNILIKDHCYVMLLQQRPNAVIWIEDIIYNSTKKKFYGPLE